MDPKKWSQGDKFCRSVAIVLTILSILLYLFLPTCVISKDNGTILDKGGLSSLILTFAFLLILWPINKHNRSLIKEKIDRPLEFAFFAPLAAAFVMALWATFRVILLNTKRFLVETENKPPYDYRPADILWIISWTLLAYLSYTLIPLTKEIGDKKRIGLRGIIFATAVAIATGLIVVTSRITDPRLEMPKPEYTLIILAGALLAILAALAALKWLIPEEKDSEQ